MYSFQLHGQSYDCFFSFGTSNSEGVGVAIKRNLGLRVERVAEVSGRLLIVDLEGQIGQDRLQIINLYAPNDGFQH